MAVEKGRWAIIVKETGEVSDIKRMEGSKPDISHPERYDVIEVDTDVKIGMVRGADGKFAFPAEKKLEKADDQGGPQSGAGKAVDEDAPAGDADAGKPAGKGKSGKTETNPAPAKG